MSGNRYRLKSYSVYAVFLLCFAGLYARLYVLQIVNHRDLSTRGEQLHRFNVKISRAAAPSWIGRAAPSP